MVKGKRLGKQKKAIDWFFFFKKKKSKGLIELGLKNSKKKSVLYWSIY